MKKIVFMVVGILVVIGLVGAGTFAYFSDTEQTTDNVIQAGTIALELSLAEPFGSGIFTFLDIKPCEDLVAMTIKLENVGQNNGYLYQKIYYIEEDKSEVHLPDLTADEFAALIYVKSITYQHFSPSYPEGGNPRDDLPGMMAMDANEDGYLSLYEMQCNWMPYSAVYPEDPGDPEHTLQVGHTATWTIVFHMADSLDGHIWGSGDPTEALEFDVEDNAPQADGINITWTTILRQNRAIDNPLPSLP